MVRGEVGGKLGMGTLLGYAILSGFGQKMMCSVGQILPR